MTDRITKEQRSKNMSAVKSRGNKSTEQKFLAILKENKISGWRRQYKRLIGTPDFAFPKQKMAVFIDGCFWHGCKFCRTIPKTNIEFWEDKISRNKKRDKTVSLLLRKSGWFVLRIPEHELKKGKPFTKVINKIYSKYYNF